MATGNNCSGGSRTASQRISPLSWRVLKKQNVGTVTARGCTQLRMDGHIQSLLRAVLFWQPYKSLPLKKCLVFPVGRQNKPAAHSLDLPSPVAFRGWHAAASRASVCCHSLIHLQKQIHSLTADRRLKNGAIRVYCRT